MMNSHTNAASIITGLASHEAQPRKLAAFTLQGTLSKDEFFAEAFSQAGGLPILRRVILDERGNTLAYALGSLTQFLQLGMGWGQVDKSVVSLAVDLVVHKSVINVLRNALLLLVLVVTQAPPEEPLDLSVTMPLSSTHSFDYTALNRRLKEHPDFLASLAEKLESADHVLCANALQLITELFRDSVENGEEDEWPRFFRQLQDLGVFVAVEQIMRGDAVADLFEHIHEFQTIFKTLMKRWRRVIVQTDNPLYRKALLAVHHNSFPLGPNQRRRTSAVLDESLEAEDTIGDETAWQRLGFSSEKPTLDFDNTGLLGLVDLSEYVRGHSDDFKKALLEQSILPMKQGCPIARASLSVTKMLLDQFEVDAVGLEDTRPLDPAASETERTAFLDRSIRPCLVRWNAIHALAVNLFIRLWTSAHAEDDEFDKISDLVRLFIDKTLRATPRKESISTIEDAFDSASLSQARDLHAKDLDQAFESAWGDDLSQLRKRMHDEAVRFMQEQRIQCLLAGAWFPIVQAAPQIQQNTSTNPSKPDLAMQSTLTAKPNQQQHGHSRVSVTAWRYVKLSSGRRHLHHCQYTQRPSQPPQLAEMRQRIDVNHIKSVVSHVAVVDWADANGTSTVVPQQGPDGERAAAERNSTTATATSSMLTHIRIVGTTRKSTEEKELLALHTPTPSLASEWLDGLLLLLHQQPITADTERMIRLIESWSLKAQMMNLDRDDKDAREGLKDIVVPGREGLDTNYWYSMGDD